MGIQGKDHQIGGPVEDPGSQLDPNRPGSPEGQPVPVPVDSSQTHTHSRLTFKILQQPTDSTCGPTCLHAIYSYYLDPLPLEQVIAETTTLDSGGTLGVFLGCNALKRGYRVTIYTYNLHVFDPTWFEPGGLNIAEKLAQQALEKSDPKLLIATRGYREFLGLGGRIRFQDLNESLIRGYLRRGVPILTGLSATYLHRSAREHGLHCTYDDIRGDPSGHFVVLYGYDKQHQEVYVAEPLHPNPLAFSQYYRVGIDRVICSILLGIVTYDANLVIIEKPASRHAKSDSR